MNYYTIYQTAQGIWRKIGKIKDVYQPHQTVDTRFLEAAAEFFPNAAAAAAGQARVRLQGAAQARRARPSSPRPCPSTSPRGSSTLDENAKAVLETQVVDLAATFGSAYLRIAGNTDNVGSRDANVRLSRARADAVARSWSRRASTANKFEVVGNGPDKPVASNDTDEGRAKNRRTDFEVVAALMERPRAGPARGTSAAAWPLAGVATFVGVWCVLSLRRASSRP